MVVEKEGFVPTAAPAPVVSQSAPAPRTLDAFSGASPFGAALLDGLDPFNSRILEANPALTAMAGAVPAGTLFGALIDPPSRTEAETRLAEGKAGPFEVRLARDPTRIAHLYLYRADGRRWVAYLIDVSEQKQMELQLAQAQKMQAIGQPGRRRGPRLQQPADRHPAAAWTSCCSATRWATRPTRASTRSARRASAPPTWCASCWPSAASRPCSARCWSWAS